MPYTVTLIPGDGVGPELAEAARRVIDAAGVAIAKPLRGDSFSQAGKKAGVPPAGPQRGCC